MFEDIKHSLIFRWPMTFAGSSNCCQIKQVRMSMSHWPAQNELEVIFVDIFFLPLLFLLSLFHIVFALLVFCLYILVFVSVELVFRVCVLFVGLKRKKKKLGAWGGSGRNWGWENMVTYILNEKDFLFNK